MWSKQPNNLGFGSCYFAEKPSPMKNDFVILLSELAESSCRLLKRKLLPSVDITLDTDVNAQSFHIRHQPIWFNDVRLCPKPWLP